MTTKENVPSSPTLPLLMGAARVGQRLAPPATMEERLQRIEAMGQRITGYIQFMCQVGGLNGTSVEAKERAVNTFYERMLIVERQLGHIQETLQLE